MMREMGHYRSSVLDSQGKPEDSMNIVLLGEGSAGKTTMTVRVKEGKFIEQYDPTLYDVHKFKLSVDDKEENIGKINLIDQIIPQHILNCFKHPENLADFTQLFLFDFSPQEVQDTAGQEVFYDSVIDEFVRKANGIVFLYQITSQHSLQELEEKYIQKVRLIKKDVFNAVIVGNKSDLESYREVSFQDGKAVADKYRIPFYEISLKKDDKIALTIFQDLVRRLKPKKVVVPVRNDKNQHWCAKTCDIF